MRTAAPRARGGRTQDARAQAPGVAHGRWASSAAWLALPALVLALVSLAGQASAVSAVQVVPQHALLADAVQVASFQVANLPLNPKVTEVEFRVPDGFQVIHHPLDRSKAPPSWHIVSSDDAGIRFANDTLSQAIPPGGSAVFQVHVRTKDVAESEAPGWDVHLALDSELTPTQQASVPVGLSTLGVKELHVIGPPGAVDLVVSKGQKVTLQAVVSNRGTAYVNGTKVLVTSSHPSDPQEDSDTFKAVPRSVNGGITLVDFTYEFGDGLGARVLYANLTGTGLVVPVRNVSDEVNAVSRPRLSDPAGTTVVLDPGRPATLTARTELATEPGTGTPRALHTGTSFTVQVKNTGEAAALDVKVAVLLFGPDGQDQTGRFQLAGPSLLPELHGREAVALAFTLAPQPCDGEDCTAAPPDGAYTVTLDFRFWDENTKVNDSTPKKLQTLVTGAPLLVIDSTPPTVGFEPFPPTVEFRRGGAAAIALTANITEANLDAGHAWLVVLDDRRAADCASVPPPGSSPAEPAGLRCVRANLTMASAGGRWSASFDVASMPLADALGDFPVYVFAADRAGNWANASAGAVRVVDTEAPRLSGVAVTAAAGSGAPGAVDVRATVREAYRLGAVYARALHEGTGEDVFVSGGAHSVDGATPQGVPLRCEGECGEEGGNHAAAGLPLPLEGNYEVRVVAVDASYRYGPGAAREPAPNRAESDPLTVRVVAGAPPGVAAIAVEPQLAVESPPLVDEFRYAAAGTPVTVALHDPQLDPRAPGAVAVEVRRGGAPWGSVAPAVAGASPNFHLTVPLAPEGEATVRVTATNAANITASLEFTVRFDTVPPTGSIEVDPSELGAKAARPPSGPLVVAPDTRLLVRARDEGAGVGSVDVTLRTPLGGLPAVPLPRASAGFSLGALLGHLLRDGSYAVAATVRDRVGNEADVPELAVLVDARPPAVEPLRAADPLVVTARDAGAGVGGVEVLWAPDPEAPRQRFALELQGADTWTGHFPPGASGRVVFLVRAVDQVGNAVESLCGGEPCLLDLGEPPALSLLVSGDGGEVVPGGAVQGMLRIAWEADDPGGGPVMVTVRVRDAAGRGRLLAENLTAGPLDWDTTRDPDGRATLTLTGSSGGRSATATVVVIVDNLRAGAESLRGSAGGAAGALPVPGLAGGLAAAALALAAALDRARRRR